MILNSLIKQRNDMKNILIILLGVMLYSSCEQKELNLNEEESKYFDSDLVKYFTLYDSGKENSMILEITFPNHDYAELYRGENFDLVINPEKEDEETEFLYGDVNTDVINDKVPIKIRIVDVKFNSDVKEYKIIDNNIIKADPSDSENLRACSYSDTYYLYENSYATGVKTKNKTNKICNNFLVTVWLMENYPNLNNYFVRYESRKKHGMTYTYRPDSYEGLSVEIYYGKRAEWDIIFLY